jgi:hypothetical protein
MEVIRISLPILMFKAQALAPVPYSIIPDIN